MPRRRPAGPPDVWGIADIMAELQVSRVTVAKWRQQPSWPTSGTINRGRTEVWDPGQVLEWVTDHAGVNAIADRARDLAASRH